MAASLKEKRTPVTTPPYQVPSVDVTPDPPIFSLVTTYKEQFFHFFHQFLYSRSYDPKVYGGGGYTCPVGGALLLRFFSKFLLLCFRISELPLMKRLR
jgi:hypothetical protein